MNLKPCSVVICSPLRDLAERALENGGSLLVGRGELDALAVEKCIRKRKLKKIKQMHHHATVASYNERWLANLRESLYGRIEPLNFKPKSLLLKSDYPSEKWKSDRIEENLVDLNVNMAHNDQTFDRFKGPQASTPYWLMMRAKEKMERKMELDKLFKEFEKRKQKCAKLSRSEGPVNLDCIDYLYK